MWPQISIIILKHIIGSAIGCVIIFWLTLGLPDAAFLLSGGYATGESIRALKSQMNLNGSIWQRFIDYVDGLVTGSTHGFYSAQPLTEIIGPKLFVSAEIFAWTLIALGLFAVGWLMAFHMLRRANFVRGLVVSGGASIPLFVSAIILLYISTALGIAPRVGSAISLAFFPALLLATNMHQRWRAIRNKPYVVLGVHYRISRFSKMVRRILEYAPSFSIVFNSMAFFVASGLAIVEWMFGLPGFGRWTLESILRLDLPAVFLSGVIITVAVGFLLMLQEIANLTFIKRQMT